MMLKLIKNIFYRDIKSRRRIIKSRGYKKYRILNIQIVINSLKSKLYYDYIKIYNIDEIQEKHHKDCIDRFCKEDKIINRLLKKIDFYINNESK